MYEEMVDIILIMWSRKDKMHRLQPLMICLIPWVESVELRSSCVEFLPCQRDLVTYCVCLFVLFFSCNQLFHLCLWL